MLGYLFIDTIMVFGIIGAFALLCGIEEAIHAASCHMHLSMHMHQRKELHV